MKQIDEMQTHFMGQIDSCTNYYQLGQDIPELDGFTGFLGPLPEGWVQSERDDLISFCEGCEATVDLAAFILTGKVMAVWPYNWSP